MATRHDVARASTISAASPGDASKTARIRVALLLFVCLPLAGCGFYSANPITARVVDADSGTPLAGVNVIAAWRIAGGMNYGATVGYMNVMETVTDSNGIFAFPGWGPRPNFHSGKIFQEAPTLMFYKAGYRFKAEANNGSVFAEAPSVTRSDWNNKTIPIKKAPGSVGELMSNITSFDSAIRELEGAGAASAIAKTRCVLAAQEDDLGWPNDRSGAYHLKELLASGVKCELQEQK